MARKGRAFVVFTETSGRKQQGDGVDSIEIDSLSKTYRGGKGPPVRAVDNLTLSVPAGQVFGFLGPNGAGKTTTVKMICGLVTPTAGGVRLNGYDVARRRGQAMRQIGVVLEGTRNVYWRLSAWDNVMYFGRLKGCPGRQLRARAEGLLKELDLWDRRKSEVKDFSRGMQQKLAIACALVADPPIVLLDEPTLGLDVQAARTVEGWIRKLSKEEGKTVLLTTHQLTMAQELCDRVAIIHRGRLVADRSIGELLGLYSQDFYQIRVRGHLDGRQGLFPGLTVTEIGEDTILSGAIADQNSLHHILREAHKLGLDLISVQRSAPDLEEVFLRLVQDEEA